LDHYSNKIYFVKGENYSCFAITDEALLFSMKKFYHIDEFNQSWAKRSWLSGKNEIKFNNIKHVRKETPGKTVYIKYNSDKGMTAMEDSFSFDNEEDFEEFAIYLEKEQFFKRHDKQLSRLTAAASSFIGVAIFSVFILFQYGKYMHPDAFNFSWLIPSYLFYLTLKRYFKPPVEIKLTPANM
jgi:hypothetical protein